jgi:DNA-binding beta-propeller fold protein YncE
MPCSPENPVVTVVTVQGIVAPGFSGLQGILYDGANIWVTDVFANTLLKLGSAGGILQTVTVGSSPGFPVFDGTSIWAPNVDSASVSVVRASSGAILATLTGNGLNSPLAAAFDGQRILITNLGGNSVSIWKAADLTAIGTFPMGAGASPYGACSDGINFWVGLQGSNRLARF